MHFHGTGGQGGSVATPRSSDITVIGSPEAGVTTTVADGNAGAGLIDDDEAELRLVGVLRESGRSGQQAEERRARIASFGERVRLEVLG